MVVRIRSKKKERPVSGNKSLIKKCSPRITQPPFRNLRGIPISILIFEPREQA
jgi:hypothetical protein